ncbi:MAG: YIP1 family protein [Haloarculaceae archaeon]
MSVTQAVRNPRGYLVRTLGMYRALLFDPEEFYEEYLGSRGLRSEILIVALVGVVGLVGNYLAREQVSTAFTQAEFPINSDTNFELIRLVIEPLVGVFLLWIGLALALYGVSWLYSTVGQFYELLKRSAWAVVPLLVANLLHTVAVTYAAFQVTEDDVADLEVPRPPVDRAQFMWDQAAGEVYVTATVLVAVVFVVWGGYIAAYAVRDVRDLETDEALRVAAVPAGLYALYVLYQGVTALV